MDTESLGYRDRSELEAIERKVVAEDMARLGLKPTDPANLWDFYAEGERIVIQPQYGGSKTKHLEKWLRFLQAPGSRTTEFFTDGGTTLELVVHGPERRSASFKDTVPRLQLSAQSLPKMLELYPTAYATMSRQRIGDAVGALLRTFQERNDLNAIIQQHKQTPAEQ